MLDKKRKRSNALTRVAPVYHAGMCQLWKRDVQKELRIYQKLQNIRRYRKLTVRELESKANHNFEMTELKQVEVNSHLQFAEVVALLQRIHNAGVIHADMKPEHIRTRKKKKLVLIDFGESWEEQSTANPQPEGGFTIGYASVERLLFKPVHCLDDLESLVWIALAGRGWGGIDLTKIHQRDQIAVRLAFLARAFDAMKKPQPLMEPMDSEKRHLLNCLLYLQSLKRDSNNPFGVAAEVYDNLRDPLFKFDRAAYDKALTTNYRGLCWATVEREQVRQADAEEQLLKSNNLNFMSGAPCHETYVSQAILNEKGQAHAISRNGRLVIDGEVAKSGCLAELDALIEISEPGTWADTNPLIFTSQLVEPYPLVKECAGNLVLREVARTDKPFDDLDKKLRNCFVEGADARPLQILRTVAGLDVLANSLPQGLTDAASIAVGCLRLHVCLAVVILAGRFSSKHVTPLQFFFAEFPPEAFLRRNTATMQQMKDALAELQEKADKLQEKADKLQEKADKFQEEAEREKKRRQELEARLAQYEKK